MTVHSCPTCDGIDPEICPVELIRSVLSRGSYQMPCDDRPYQTQAHAVWEAIRGPLTAERDRYKHAAITTEHEVEQILGKALGYPVYGPDMGGGPDVCVGDHVASSLASQAVDRLTHLTAERDQVAELYAKALETEERLRAALKAQAALVIPTQVTASPPRPGMGHDLDCHALCTPGQWHTNHIKDAWECGRGCTCGTEKA